MLYDRDAEEDREVDIFVEDIADLVPVTTGIECTYTKLKARIQQVNFRRATHRVQSIDRTIIVLRNKFSQPPAKTAESIGVKLLTLDFKAYLAENVRTTQRVSNSRCLVPVSDFYEWTGEQGLASNGTTPER